MVMFESVVLSIYIVATEHSKKISNDQKLIQSIPTSSLKTKKEITKYINWQQFTEGTRGKSYEQVFSKQVVI